MQLLDEYLFARFKISSLDEGGRASELVVEALIEYILLWW